MVTRRDIVGSTVGSKRFGAAASARLAPALLGAAALVAGLPTGALAVVAMRDGAPQVAPMMHFTPANVDPVAARRMAAKIAARGHEMRFTPAGVTGAKSRTMTVAVRVDGEVARAISVRSAIAAAETKTAGIGTPLAAIAPTRYDLGIARGYRSFAKPASVTPVDMGLDSPALPDLASFRPSEGAQDKPSRFQGTLALGTETRAGRSPRTLEGLGDQSVDLSAGYRLSRSLNVTAGVRVTQDRNRLAPLTDGKRDDQAVYVGTQFRF